MYCTGKFDYISYLHLKFYLRKQRFVFFFRYIALIRFVICKNISVIPIVFIIADGKRVSIFRPIMFPPTSFKVTFCNFHITPLYIRSRRSFLHTRNHQCCEFSPSLFLPNRRLLLLSLLSFLLSSTLL